MARYNEKKILGVIFFLAVGLSLVYSFSYRIAPVVDAQAYDKIAVNLLAGNGFREESAGPILFDPSIVRAGPGYEYFLAGTYLIFGHHYWAVWILQALLHGLTVLLIYYSCRQAFGPEFSNAGLWAAAIIGLHPDLIEISAMLMTETLYIFLTALIIFCFLKLYENPVSKVWLILLGAVSALGVLTRPPLLLVVPIVLLMLFWARSLKSTLWYLAAFVVPIIPWIVRNYLVYHKFILTTLIGEYNLWVGNTLLANGGQISGGFNAVTDYTTKSGFGELASVAHAAFYSFLFSHPAAFIKLCLIRFVRYFSLIRPMGFWFYQTGPQQTAFVVASGVSIAILFILGLAGILLALRERSARINYLIVLTLTAPLLLLPTVVQSRYRFQIYPFLAIFSGYAVVKLMEQKSKLKNPYFISALIFFGVISAIDILTNTPLVIERITKLF